MGTAFTTAIIRLTSRQKRPASLVSGVRGYGRAQPRRWLLVQAEWFQMAVKDGIEGCGDVFGRPVCTLQHRVLDCGLAHDVQVIPGEPAELPGDPLGPIR